MTSGSPAPQPLVLIVDDDERNLRLARDVLRAAGLRTIEGSTGAEGIELAGRHLPDVILMDLGLPDMDGAAVARALGEQAHTARIPVVALTALPQARRVVPRGRVRRLPREAVRRPRVPRSRPQLLRSAGS